MTWNMEIYLYLPSVPRHWVINTQRRTSHINSSGIDYVPGTGGDPDVPYPPELIAEGVSIGGRTDNHHVQYLEGNEPLYFQCDRL